MQSRSPAPPRDGDRFAFVIPVYNHVATVAQVVAAAQRFGFPIFVVDDGSTDGSAAAAGAITGVEVLRHSANLGKGAALRTGFAAAARVANWAITVDADGQHNPADAAALIARLPPGERPIIVGSRMHMDGDRRIPWTSRFGRKFSNFWVTSSGGPRLSDSQSGFRLYPLPEVLTLPARARRFQYEVEILALAGWRKMPVHEAPISVTYAPETGRISHFRPWVDFWRNAATFMRLIAMRIIVPRSLRARSRHKSSTASSS